MIFPMNSITLFICGIRVNQKLKIVFEIGWALRGWSDRPSPRYTTRYGLAKRHQTDHKLYAYTHSFQENCGSTVLSERHLIRGGLLHIKRLLRGVENMLSTCTNGEGRNVLIIISNIYYFQLKFPANCCD